MKNFEFKNHFDNNRVQVLGESRHFRGGFVLNSFTQNSHVET